MTESDEGSYVTYKGLVGILATTVVLSFSLAGFVLALHSQHPHSNAVDKDDLRYIKLELTEIKSDQKSQRQDIRELLQRTPKP